MINEVLNVLLVLGLVVLAVVSALLAILLLALIIPTAVYLKYENDEFAINLSFFGLRFKLYPDIQKQWWYPKKNKSNFKQSEKQKDKKKTAGKAAKKTLSQFVSLLRAGGMAVSLILKNLKIRNIKLVLPIEADDADEVAKKYGKTHAWLHSTLGVLNNLLYLEFEKLEIEPIFAENLKTKAYFSCKITAQLFIIVVVAYRLFGMLRDDEDLRAFFIKTPSNKVNKKEG